MMPAASEAKALSRSQPDALRKNVAYVLETVCRDLPDRGGCHAVAQLRRELKKHVASAAESRQARDRAVTALRRVESDLRLVSAALISSQEMERKRIAGELHDSIGQAVGSFGFGVGVALDLMRAGDAGGAEEMLLRVAAHARQTMDEVRRVAMDLRPATLDDLGLIGTLSWFFREFRFLHPELNVITEISLGEDDVPPGLVTIIYRVVQEACSNVVRHAGAGELQVALYRRARSIHLRIDDNGRGIAASQGGSGRQRMGLRGMRDRVEFSGGSFGLDSRAGAGTAITAAWPLSGAYCLTPDSEGNPSLDRRGGK